MGEVRYMISEAAKRLETDVDKLHQWEEDLNLPVGKTEKEHRFYTEEDIQLFRCIKELKEQGVTKKELKRLIPDLLHTKAQIRLKKQLIDSSTVDDKASDIPCAAQTPKELKLEDRRTLTADQNAELQLLANLMQEMLEKNNIVLGESICTGVSEKVTQSIEFLLQAKERSEEERYRNLDHLIRQQQAIRKESTKTTTLKRLFKLIATT